MAGPRPWTPDEEQQLRDLNATETSLTEVARRLGRPKASVSLKAKALGLTWDRQQTRAATAAHRTDAASRRARLEVRLLAAAEEDLDARGEPITYVDHGGRDFVRVEVEADRPIPADRLKLMQSATIAIDRALKIAEHDAGDGAEPARNLLADLGRALGVTPRDA